MKWWGRSGEEVNSKLRHVALLWALHTMCVYNEFEHWIKLGIISSCWRLQIKHQTNHHLKFQKRHWDAEVRVGREEVKVKILFLVKVIGIQIGPPNCVHYWTLSIIFQHTVPSHRNTCFFELLALHYKPCHIPLKHRYPQIDHTTHTWVAIGSI